MAMQIKYPTTGLPQLPTLIPTSFTAWGTYNPADAPTAGSCSVTVAGGGVVNGTQFQFRPNDGIWTCQIAGLTIGNICRIDAAYTPAGGGNVPAPGQTNLQVSPIAITILPPAENSESSLLQRLRAAALPPGPAPAPPLLPFPAGTAINVMGTYPPFIGVKDVAAVVHRDDIPIAYASATRGLVSLGQWTVLVPTPADIVTVNYIIEILLLDQNGTVVRTTRRAF